MKRFLRKLFETSAQSFSYFPHCKSLYFFSFFKSLLLKENRFKEQ
ncbi:hypothetical protein LEP1GSC074_2875 [Leptospira noguchii str. Hook]|nr:hypothetical protein LEP1GSC074_2875 [Leptospira noguchii str. Hook]